MTALQITWYILMYVLITGYVILDGFDLGVGLLLPFITKNETQRRTLLNAIGPFWDGNEVWLLTAAGAMFAAFPHVYATLFSGFYLAFMLLLLGLILRAVSFEFRKQVADHRWRRVWDWLFFAGSLLPAFLTGVVMGAVLRGVPLTVEMEYSGTIISLINPFTLLMGLGGLALYSMQGMTFILMKTRAELAHKARRAAMISWLFFVGVGLVNMVVAWNDLPQRFAVFSRSALTLLLPIAVIVLLFLLWRSLGQASDKKPFLYSSITIVGMMGTFAAANFPYLLPASDLVQNGLTLYNASASARTLQAMLIIVLIGMPLVILYTIFAHRVFRGKVKLDEEGY